MFRPLIIKDRTINDSVPRYLHNCYIPIVASGQSRQHLTVRSLPALQLHDFDVPENLWVLLLTLNVPRRHGAMKLLAALGSLNQTSETYLRYHLAELGRAKWKSFKLLSGLVVEDVLQENGEDYKHFELLRVALEEYFERMEGARAVEDQPEIIVDDGA
jgi:hypothetical protein